MNYLFLDIFQVLKLSEIPFEKLRLNGSPLSFYFVTLIL